MTPEDRTLVETVWGTLLREAAGMDPEAVSDPRSPEGRRLRATADRIIPFVSVEEDRRLYATFVAAHDAAPPGGDRPALESYVVAYPWMQLERRIVTRPAATVADVLARVQHLIEAETEGGMPPLRLRAALRRVTGDLRAAAEGRLPAAA